MQIEAARPLHRTKRPPAQRQDHAGVGRRGNRRRPHTHNRKTRGITIIILKTARVDFTLDVASLAGPLLKPPGGKNAPGNCSTTLSTRFPFSNSWGAFCMHLFSILLKTSYFCSTGLTPGSSERGVPAPFLVVGAAAACLAHLRCTGCRFLSFGVAACLALLRCTGGCSLVVWAGGLLGAPAVHGRLFLVVWAGGLLGAPPVHGLFFWSFGLPGLAWRSAGARAFISNCLGCLGSLQIRRCTGFYFWSFGLAASLVLLRCTGGYFWPIQEVYQLSKCTGMPKEIHPLSNCTDGRKEKRSLAYMKVRC